VLGSFTPKAASVNKPTLQALQHLDHNLPSPYIFQLGYQNSSIMSVRRPREVRSLQISAFSTTANITYLDARRYKRKRVCDTSSRLRSQTFNILLQSRRRSSLGRRSIHTFAIPFRLSNVSSCRFAPTSSTNLFALLVNRRSQPQRRIALICLSRRA